MDKRHIQDLLPLYFENKLNEEDRQAVVEWLQESQAHQTIADDMAHIYILVWMHSISNKILMQIRLSEKFKAEF